MTVDFDTLDDNAVTVREPGHHDAGARLAGPGRALPDRAPARLLTLVTGPRPTRAGRGPVHLSGDRPDPARAAPADPRAAPGVAAGGARADGRASPTSAFRRLCREQGGGLYVCEMITTRALVERNPKTLRMIALRRGRAAAQPPALRRRPGDHRRRRADRRRARTWPTTSTSTSAARCPKVTRKGGGAALPWRRRLFARIVRAAVDAAAPAGVPVTVKMRKGIDDDHLTYLEAGLAAQDAGVAAVALHARTAAQRYSGTADWDAIATPQAGPRHPGARQRRHLGGRRRAADGRAHRRATAWWSGAAAWAGRGSSPTWRPRSTAGRSGGCPTLGEVAATMRRHAELLVDQFVAARATRPG